jgi:hypothetical protein
LISQLFRVLPAEISSHFTQVVEFVTDCLDHDRFTNNFYLNLLAALPEVVGAIAETDGLEETDNHGEQAAFIFSLYRRFPPPEAIPTDKNAIETVNRMYEVLFKGYGSIIRYAYRADYFLIAHRRQLFEPTEHFLEVLGRHATDITLRAYLEFVKNGVQYLPRRCNIMLSRMSVRRALILAQSRADAAMRERAAGLYRRVATR